jgi:hypothetical protein
MIKKLLTLLLSAVFALSLASPALSAGKEINGVVSKIEGSKLTVLNSTGATETIEIKDPETLKAFKVGDQVSLKDDMVKKEEIQSPAPISKK